MRNWILGLAAVLAVFPVLGNEPFPGTVPLVEELPLDEVMLRGMEKYVVRETRRQADARMERWLERLGDPATAAAKVQEQRELLREYLGVVDQRVAPQGLEYVASTESPATLAESAAGRATAVRWQVLEGVTAEGLWLRPAGAPVARVIAIPDADWTPEMFAGLQPGVEAISQLPRRLLEAGCEVLIPTLINRDYQFSGNPTVKMTNQPHREYIQRQAFEMGRTMIGYEVQKVLGGVDQLSRLNEQQQVNLPILVVGVSEGGVLAMHSAALDPRISGCLVCGYMRHREDLAAEPIYRNVWRLLTDFGDAELAAMIAPRLLVVQACAVPEVSGPVQAVPDKVGKGAAPGAIWTNTLALVRKEVNRAGKYYEALQVPEKLIFWSSGEGDGPAGNEPAWGEFLQGNSLMAGAETKWELKRAIDDGNGRQKRQVNELVDFTQNLMRQSHHVREKLWSKGSRDSVEEWGKTADGFRKLVWNEMIGRLPEVPGIPPNVRTRKVLENEQYDGYEVLIDVQPQIVAAGILLWPKGIRAEEKRPVVVCQHGLEGVPVDTITRVGDGAKYYSGFAHELATRGFIAYAPQNPYRGENRFRQIQRGVNPLGLSLYSFILPQHQKTLDWLKTIPQVDPSRIAFYGLSYGGKTAVRVPTLLTDYCLSICSGDFNEWVLKNVTVDDNPTYMFTGEYEIYEWNMGHTANYAELSYLMTPRPFMVERGHHDGVSYDEWVAWEYAKVRRHYAELGLADKTTIEWFLGPHKIHGVGTYEFLHKHLNWPGTK
ncbi:MAG: dienelactone hydrolase family protein [Planctomycetaceae bacterium]|nr:dienelactone hydrolase family protein [Planctomycetaceae bacterium]